MDDESDNSCPLHGCDFLQGSAPIFRGFFGTGQKYGPIWRNSFRYAESWVPGGCSVAAGRPSTEAVRFCPVCRTAEKTWLNEQLALGVDESSWEWFLAGVLGLRDTVITVAEPRSRPSDLNLNEDSATA